MQKLFEKNTPAQVAIIIATLVVLWAGPLAHPAPMAAPDGYAPLYQLLYNLHPSPLVSTLAALLLVVAGGFLLNLMLSTTGMTPQNSLIPTLLYIAFMSAFCHTLNPLLIVSLFTIACLRLLVPRASAFTLPQDRICSVAALTAVSSMFYLPSLALLAVYLVAAINYRLYSWREWAALLLGLLAPYLLLWTSLYLSGGLRTGFSLAATRLGSLEAAMGNPTPLQTAANVLLAAVLVASLVALWSRQGESTVGWKKISATLTAPVLAGLFMLPYTQLFPVDTQLFAAPFAFCGTHMLLAPTRKPYGRKRDWRPWARTATLLFTLIAAALC
ncbi:MAG: hypothetical protein J6I49_01425 [Bacteroidales bacterium]|nr:hypothetical protein [Bacteroidales bacterium]